MRKENQIIINSNKQPNPILSMKEKTKTNQGSPQCKWKILSFRTNKYKSNTKHSTFNQSLVLSESDALNSIQQREWQYQQNLRNESQVSKARKHLENLDQFQQANYRKIYVSHWVNKPKRSKSTYMSYW